MFHIRQSPFDRKHPALEGAGKAMVFGAHDFVNDLLRSILDADCIDNRPFLIGAAADALYPQLRRLSQGLPQQEAMTRADPDHGQDRQKTPGQDAQEPCQRRGCLELTLTI